MPIWPRSGSASEIRHRKSWSSSSLDGFRNETTCTPCGFTPDMTCLIVESLPAASIAWKTSSRARLSLAHNSSCASLSCSMPRARRALAVASSSLAESASYSPPPVQPVSRPARFAPVPGRTLSASAIRCRVSGRDVCGVFGLAIRGLAIDAAKDELSQLGQRQVRDGGDEAGPPLAAGQLDGVEDALEAVHARDQEGERQGHQHEDVEAAVGDGVAVEDAPHRIAPLEGGDDVEERRGGQAHGRRH